ncbi:hypothetical protein HU200_030736 [Digitaria exilis]|uniref:At1g61320/AtMIF1 LRR domain-containing protein n=1 Tax=Digitaria exilis TaxID=1010633 RepID=A0A835BR48_9POAL|nr:hypothetical protein HU200_030736 [Digitaria exilis]
MYFGGQETTAGHAHDPAKPTNINTSTGPPSVRFSDLPQDVLYRIASKLPQTEFARTSILSGDWRCISCSACPSLTFDADAAKICGFEFRHVREYINEVNAVLEKHQNKVVEALQLRIGFVYTTLLACHINAWVDFAISSRTKSLTLDLKPQMFWWEFKHRYAFPFQLFDVGSISRLQDMQLSFVSLSSPPSWFKGFPNLKRLHLQVSRDNWKDLERMLSLCRALEWLYIDRCNIDGDEQLTVDTPLSRLIYLRVEWCGLSKIRFNAVNLATFDYYGSFIPIDLVHSFKLKSANIEFHNAVFHHALVSLLNGLPSVQNMTLKICWTRPEKQWLWDNPLKFSNLRHLRLTMAINTEGDDKILYSVSILRATPFIEKLEVHFVTFGWFAEVGPCRKDLGKIKYNYLKDIWITGFNAARGQVEFLLHAVENAPALEAVSVEISKYPSRKSLATCGSPIEAAKHIATTCLCATLPQNVAFDVKE